MFTIDSFRSEYPTITTSVYSEGYPNVNGDPVSFFITAPNDGYVSVGDLTGRPYQKIRLEMRHGEEDGSGRFRMDAAEFMVPQSIPNPCVMTTVEGNIYGSHEVRYLPDRTVYFAVQTTAADTIPYTINQTGTNVHRATVAELITSTVLPLSVSFGFNVAFQDTPSAVAVANTVCTDFGTSTFNTPTYGNKLTVLMGDGTDSFAGDCAIRFVGATFYNDGLGDVGLDYNRSPIKFGVSANTWELTVNSVVVETGTGTIGDERELSLEWCSTPNTPARETALLFNEPVELQIHYRLRHRAFGGAWTVEVADSLIANVDLRGTTRIDFNTDLDGTASTSGLAYSRLDLLQTDSEIPCMHMERFNNFTGAWTNVQGRAKAEGGYLVNTFIDEGEG